MKRKAVFILFIAIMLSSAYGQKVKVQGKVTGLDTNENTIIISRVDKNNAIPVDTVTIDKKGSFHIDIECGVPTLFLVNYIGGRNLPVTHLMVLPGENITLDLQYKEDYNIMLLSKVKGSKNMELYKFFMDETYNFAKSLKPLDSAYRASNGNPAIQQELSAQFMNIQKNHDSAIEKLITEHADQLMSAFLVTYFDEDVDGHIQLYETVEKALTPKYADNQFVLYVSSKVKSSLGPGRMAPEIAMQDPDGNIRKLSDLRGKVVMIDFWASWCRPCRMENPNVVKLYKKYHDKGFDIYSVSLDKDRNEWLRAINNDGLEWPNHVSDLNGWTSSGGATYGITSVPSTVLIDRDGRIIARNLRGQELEKKLHEIFGE